MVKGQGYTRCAQRRTQKHRAACEADRHLSAASGGIVKQKPIGRTVDVPLPGVEGGAKLFDALGVLVGEVSAFADVVVQVEQFDLSARADELPRAATHGPFVVLTPEEVAFVQSARAPLAIPAPSAARKRRRVMESAVRMVLRSFQSVRFIERSVRRRPSQPRRIATARS
jgi:hypothetical protein